MGCCTRYKPVWNHNTHWVEGHNVTLESEIALLLYFRYIYICSLHNRQEIELMRYFQTLTTYLGSLCPIKYTLSLLL
jgi:hypothetical protein